jgi:hypothetical protein
MIAPHVQLRVNICDITSHINWQGSGDAHRIESRVQCKDIIPLAVFDMKDNSVDMNLEVRMTHPMVRNPHSICSIRSKLQLPDQGL